MAGSLMTSSSPRASSAPEYLAEARVHHVAIDQQHGDVLFQAHAECQVQRGEGLALAGHGARDHHQVALGERLDAATERVVDERALDLAKLLRELALLVRRWQQAREAQHIQIDGHDAPVGRLARRLEPARSRARCAVGRSATGALGGLQPLDCVFNDTHAISP